MKKALLLLGGSQQQVIAIEKANELGYRTVLCDYLPDNPGQYCADVFYQVSTTDRGAVLEVARKENVSGVLAYASDPAAPTAAYVAEALDLPTNPLSAVETLSYKHKFRSHLKANGLPCPKATTFLIDDSIDAVRSAISDLALPFVVKPTDASGSKGVSVVSSLSQLEAAVEYAKKFARGNVLIAEEYIERTFPYVVGGDIFVVDGEVRFWGLMSCLRDPESDLVPMGEFFPAGLTDFQINKIQDVVRRLVCSLGIRFGELNVEILLGKHDTPYILELGARAGGNMIPVQLSDISGIDLVKANVLCAMGENPGSMEFDRHDVGYAWSTYVLHSLCSGTYEGWSCSEPLRGCVYREVPYIESGCHVDCFDGANKAIGMLFMRFENEEALRTFVNDPLSQINVLVGGQAS